MAKKEKKKELLGDPKEHKDTIESTVRLAHIVTEDRMAQRVAFEIITHYCDDITIGKAKSMARDMSVKIRNTFHHIENETLRIDDEQANSMDFWIDQIVNAGKNFNQKP